MTLPVEVPAIDASGVARRFGRRWAVAGVSLRVAPGTRLMVTGRNGSGKSTLLRVLATASRLDQGEAPLWWERLEAGGSTNGGGGIPLAYQVRWKAPDGATSRKLEWPVVDGGARAGSPDLRFAAAVAAFGMLLRRSPHAGSADLSLVRRLAGGALDPDPNQLRRSFLQLLDAVDRLGGVAAR